MTPRELEEFKAQTRGIATAADYLTESMLLVAAKALVELVKKRQDEARSEHGNS